MASYTIRLNNLAVNYRACRVLVKPLHDRAVPARPGLPSATFRRGSAGGTTTVCN